VNCANIDTIFNKSVSDFEKLILVNRNNNIICSSNNIENDDKLQIMKKSIDKGLGYVEDKDDIAIANISAYDGWKQVAIISKDKLFSKVNRLFAYFVVMVISSLLFILLIMIPIILNITGPISMLVAAMKKVSKGDLDTSIEIDSGDELEIMGKGFNKMVGALKEYMITSINDERVKRRMQMDLLISQINPHFIYNTLNTIIYLTNANRNKDAVKITDSFIRILQDTVKTGDEALFASVREELGVIRNYLNIQSYRYPDMFDTEYLIDEAVKDVEIPRMAIQPIVENALFHGIHPCEEKGHLKIMIKSERNKVIIAIEDNGVGMDEKTVKNIFSGVKSTKTGQHTRRIGLKNVRERLDFLYDGKYDMKIFSSEGQGTKVLISIPSRDMHILNLNPE
jgi:two-component system sensor histidine kinase YesM